ncbi:MAG: transposase [Gemmataceae bacterium]|nr:transposase [Gemmataceae bacterium]
MRSADREQLIPPMRLEDLLEEGHQARLVWDFCLGLDLAPLLDPIRSRLGGPGRAALDPRIGVALWLYATLEGVGSARALDFLCVEHNAFRWLTGGVSVNYHTLADSRVSRLDFLDGLLTRSVAVLREQGLVDLNRVAHDGMRVRASAGAASFRRKPTLEECLAEAEDQVARLKEEMEDDPSAPSRRHAAARERAARERAERLEAALARIPEMEAKKKADEKDKARCSTTDPEATVVKMADGGCRPASNVRFAADTASQVIVGVDVIATGSDMGQTTPMLDQINARHGKYPGEHLADGGFAKHEDIEAAQAAPRGTTAYVPVPEPRKAKGPKEGAAPPAGRPEEKKRDKHEPMPGDSEADRAWRVRMGTAVAKEIYKERASTAECVNAQARNRGLTRLLVRGLAKVKAAVMWFAIAHNVARWFSLRGGATAVAA